MERKKNKELLETLKKNSPILQTSLVDCIPLRHYSQSTKRRMYLTVHMCAGIHTNLNY